MVYNYGLNGPAGLYPPNEGKNFIAKVLVLIRHISLLLFID
jgi:hypothetical protein